MSVRVMTWVWDTPLPPAEKLALLALADCANDEGMCWPSIAALERKTGSSERTVQRAIKALGEKGFLRWEDTPGKGRRYFLNPRHGDTPVMVTPVSQCREPPSPCHPTPGKVTPHPRHGDTQTVIEPSSNRQEPSEVVPPDGDPTTSDVIEGWNNLAGRCGLPAMVKLTDKRRRDLSAQFKRFPPMDWQAVFEAIEGSSFLCGRNERGWRVDFDFILKEGNFVKILEGKYSGEPDTRDGFTRALDERIFGGRKERLSVGEIGAMVAERRLKERQGDDLPSGTSVRGGGPKRIGTLIDGKVWHQ